jgi:hypothetical protein
LGLTAVLAAAGFIGKIALQQFLGIELGNWTALDLSTFAGRWAIDTVTVILERVLDHPLTIGIPILLYFTPPLVVLSLPPKHRALRVMTYVSLGISTASLAAVLGWCEMPTLEMNDWLMSSLHDQLAKPDPGLLNARVADLKATLLVSKMDGVTAVCPVQASTDARLKNLQSHLQGNDPVTHARTYLNDMYAISVLVCASAFLVLYFRSPVETPAALDEWMRGVRLFVTMILLPLVSCLIPYMYGKLLYPTTFPEVTVTFADGTTTDSMLLMDETDKEVSLLTAKNALSYEVTVRQRDAISLMRRYGDKDVLNTILLGCNWLSTAGGQSSPDRSMVEGSGQ